MKRFVCLFIVFTLSFSLCGCHRLLGAALLKLGGMEFTSQIEGIEKRLDINLKDMTDENIKIILSSSDMEGNHRSIEYIDCEDCGDTIEKQLMNNEKWKKWPLSDEVYNFLSDHELLERPVFIDDKIDRFLLEHGLLKPYISSIEEGYWTACGFSTGEFGGYDFNLEHFDSWYCCKIGIWDSRDKTFYCISVTA